MQQALATVFRLFGNVTADSCQGTVNILQFEIEMGHLPKETLDSHKVLIEELTFLKSKCTK